MKLSLLFSTPLSLLLTASAFAAEPAAPEPPASNAAAPSIAIAAPPVPVAPPPAPSGCSLGDHGGIGEADAATATRIVCSELANAGARADEPYRVDLSRLGESVILSVSLGSSSRTLRLAKIEEVPVAAPRLAEALVHGKSLASTEKVDNLVGDETRTYQKRAGEFRFGLGVLGTQIASAPAAIDPGLVLQLLYEMPHFAVGVDMRGSGSATNGPSDNAYFALGPTARYFFMDGDVTPYLGGGIAFSTLSVKPRGMMGARATGISPFVEFGVEALRLHRARVSLGIRIDLPLQSLKDDGQSWYSGDVAPASAAGYYAPISLATTVAW